MNCPGIETSIRTAVFLSDVHLGLSIPGAEYREKALISFLRGIRTEASHLFLLGDIFDFWMEYRYAIRPDYFQILHELKLLVDAGVEVHHLSGNHDFAIGSFLSREIGLILHDDPLELRLPGKRLWLSHGDRLVETGILSRTIRRILRSPINQRLFRLLHPDMGIRLGQRVSRLSRSCVNNGIKPNEPETYRKAAAGILSKNFDVVVMGHTHYPEILRFGEKWYVNTGQWIYSYNYCLMRDNGLTLWEFSLSGESRQIPETTLFPSGLISSASPFPA
jgi:UDP-2,3-diacylglucosamine hydrolase